MHRQWITISNRSTTPRPPAFRFQKQTKSPEKVIREKHLLSWNFQLLIARAENNSNESSSETNPALERLEARQNPERLCIPNSRKRITEEMKKIRSRCRKARGNGGRGPKSSHKSNIFLRLPISVAALMDVVQSKSTLEVCLGRGSKPERTVRFARTTLETSKFIVKSKKKLGNISLLVVIVKGLRGPVLVHKLRVPRYTRGHKNSPEMQIKNPLN